MKIQDIVNCKTFNYLEKSQSVQKTSNKSKEKKYKYFFGKKNA